MPEPVPTSTARLNRMRTRVQRYLQEGMWSAASAALEALLQRAPDDVWARLTLAKLQLQTGRLQAATGVLLGLAQRPPNDAAAIVELAQLLTAVGEIVAARHCLDLDALAHTASRATMVAAAHARFRLGEPAAALAWMDRAIACGGNPVREEQHFRALLLQFVGRMDEANAVLDACLQQSPGFGSAALTRSRLRRQSAATQHLDDLRAQASEAQPESLDAAAFQFALFKELDDLERYDEAWSALQRANAIMHGRNPYDEAGDARALDAIMRHVDADVCRPDTDGQPGDPLPIFIVGMPRSGTTLLDRMLGNHSQVTSAGELRDFLAQWRWVADIGAPSADAFVAALGRCADVDYRQLGERYLQQTAWRAHGAARFIDKMPSNFQSVGLIHRALPGARILNVVRDPIAVCFSNFKAMFGDESPHCYDQRLLARYWLAHERLRQHWHRVAPGAMLDVSYEALVRSPADTMRQVLAFCGLGFEDDCLHPTRNQTPVSTPSSAQVREPIHARGIDEWRHYAAQLAPMRACLEAGNRPLD